jgi:uncharacterized protein YjdB
MFAIIMIMALIFTTFFPESVFADTQTGSESVQSESTSTVNDVATYTVTFDMNGGTVSEEDADTTVTASCAAGDTVEFPDDPYYQDHEFIGWSTDEAADPEDTESLVDEENYVPASDVTLYAVWKETESSESSASASETVTDDSSASVSETDVDDSTMSVMSVSSSSSDSDATISQASTDTQTTDPVLQYRAGVQNGDLSDWVNGGTDSDSGTVGQTMESLYIRLLNGDDSSETTGDEENVISGVSYSVHVQNIGWQDWVSDGQMAGTEGESKQIEAVKIKLSDDLDNSYDIYYRTYIQDVGWTGWASNGASSGSTGLGLRMEAIQIELVKKGEAAPGSTSGTFTSGATISGNAHVENSGWNDQDVTGNDITVGTTGRGLRMEALRLSVSDPLITGTVEYCAHVQNIGWQDCVSNGATAGTTGRRLQMEAVQIRLTGNLASVYDIYYRVHIENKGWLGWTSNGASAGSTGHDYRIEAIEIKLVRKGQGAPGSTSGSFFSDPVISYGAHVQNIGWKDVTGNNATAGTTGRGLQMEALRLSISDPMYSGGVQYKAHVQNIGWQDWVSNGATAGTTGRGLQMEAVQIRLTGNLASAYDIYYRVHIENKGWLGWAKNGASAGSTSYGYRIEAIQIRLVKKGQSAPGSTSGAYFSGPSVSYNAHVQNIGWQGAKGNGEVAGTTGQNLRMEALTLSISDPLISGGVQYKAHVQNIGWQSWVSNGHRYDGQKSPDGSCTDPADRRPRLCI